MVYDRSERPLLHARRSVPECDEHDRNAAEHRRQVLRSGTCSRRRERELRRAGIQLLDEDEERGNRNEGGDGAAGTAAIELWAYAKFGDAKYLQAAKWSMDYLERSNSSLFYEILPQMAPYLAARMNAQFGTDYNVEDFDWILGGSAVRPGWGTIVQRWGSYDTYGLIGSQTDGGGYAFAMNTFSAPLFAATAKYDPRFADMSPVDVEHPQCRPLLLPGPDAGRESAVRSQLHQRPGARHSV